MAKAKQSKTKRSSVPPPAREQSTVPGTGSNKRLTAQNRKLLGKH
jgi:hypothetical protein